MLIGKERSYALGPSKGTPASEEGSACLEKVLVANFPKMGATASPTPPVPLFF